MTLLESVTSPGDLRALDAGQLATLADEIRAFLVANVARTGGHLGPNLGAVELTIALHRVFDSPRDRLIWDTGHQTYVHKLLTGRRDHFTGLRKWGGISGYPNRGESPHDHVENSHASTALSYADGIAKGLALRGEHDRSVVAIVGDGSLTGGMAWEALNNIGGHPERSVVVVLNDNGRSYAPTIGGLAAHLAELRRTGTAENMFRSLGFGYVGPVDGHDVPAVEAALRAARDAGTPVVVHCVTTKGRGYRPAEVHELDHFHSVGPMDAGTGQPLRSGARSWTSVFGDELVAVARDNDDVVAVTAAMLDPAGLSTFEATFPDRIFDVGIAEQHAVTSAAGLAMAGLHPVVAIYSTFLNRALDQVLMDVAMHELGVTFVLDRAGVTGDDGASHNGMWDLSMLQMVPGLRMCVPRDGNTLRDGLRHAVTVSDRPTLIRFPKGEVAGDVPAVDAVGGVDVLRQGSSEVLLVAVGAMARPCLEAAELLAAQGVQATVVDPVWVTPVNPTLVHLAAGHDLVVTVEDSSRTGGVGAALAQSVADQGVVTPVVNLGIPRRFLPHGTRAEILAECGLTARDIANTVTVRLANSATGMPPLRLLQPVAARHDS